MIDQCETVCIARPSVAEVCGTLVHAISVFGEAAHAVQWLSEPNEALGGRVPLDLLESMEGNQLVRTELGAIQHGLPA